MLQVVIGIQILFRRRLRKATLRRFGQGTVAQSVAVEFWRPTYHRYAFWIYYFGLDCASHEKVEGSGFVEWEKCDVTDWHSDKVLNREIRGGQGCEP